MPNIIAHELKSNLEKLTSIDLNSPTTHSTMTQAFLDSLQTYINAKKSLITFHIKDRLYNMFIFGLDFAALSSLIEDMPNEYLSFTANHKSFIEASRIFNFIKNFNFDSFAQKHWPDFHKLQFKIYALYYHVESNPIDAELKQLLSVFLDKVLPLFPKDISAKKLDCLLDSYETYGSYFYDNYLFACKKEQLIIQLSSLEKNITSNYQQILNQSHHLALNEIEKYLLIDYVYKQIGNLKFQEENFLENFFKLLGDLAKKNYSAAAYWLVTAQNDGIFLKDEGPYSQFTTEELLAFLKAAMSLPDRGLRIPPDTFLSSLLDLKFKNASIADFKVLIKYLSNPELKQFNFIQFELQHTLLDWVEENKPEFINLFKQIQTELGFQYKIIYTDELGNPILKNSQHLKTTAQPFIKFANNFAEIRKYARTLSQASRTATSFFAQVPDEVNAKIAAYTANLSIHTDTESESIALSYLGWPVG